MDVYWYSSNCRSLRLPNSVVDRVAGLGLELWVDPSSEPCERHGDSK